MSCRIIRKEGKIDKVLAPNGKESKLYRDIINTIPDDYTPDEYVQEALQSGKIKDLSKEEVALALWNKVYEPSFKAWFGDSKVVDSNGEALLVYHGSPNNFNTFDETRGGKLTPIFRKGFFFTPNRKYAEEFRDKAENVQGTLYPTFLKIDNPKQASNLLNRKEAMEIFERTSDIDGIIGQEKPDADSAFDENVDVYVIPQDSPNQIKSLYNVGIFSSVNDNIYLQKEKTAPTVETGLSKDEIEKALYPVLDRLGISLHALKSRPDVVAVADAMNRMIQYNSGKADKSTLPEELMHIMIEDADGYEIERALKYVEKTPEYRDFYDTYLEEYGDPLKAKKEILGKIGAKVLIQELEYQGHSALVRMLKRMWNKFKTYFSNTGELERVLQRIAQKTVQGESLNKVSYGNVFDNSGTSEIFYDGKVVGSFEYENTGSEFTILDISIDKSGRGIGSQFYKQLGNELYKNGIQLVSKGKRSVLGNAVWRVLQRRGYAEKIGNKYYFIPSSEYMQLSEKQKLQQMINTLGKRVSQFARAGRTKRKELVQDQIAFLDKALQGIDDLSENPTDAELRGIYLSLFEFLKSVRRDTERTLEYIKDVEEGKEQLTTKRITDMSEYVSYYMQDMEDLRDLIKKDLDKLPKMKRAGLAEIAWRQINDFNRINDFIKEVRLEQSEKIIIDWASQELNLDKNAPDIKQQITDRLEYDIFAKLEQFQHSDEGFFASMGRWFGSLRTAKPQELRLIHARMARILQQVHEKTIDFAKDIIQYADDLGFAYKSMEWIAETIDGKKTGYFIQPTYRIKWENARQEHAKFLHEKHGLPEDAEERRRVKAEWREKARETIGKSGQPTPEAQKYNNKLSNYSKDWAKWFTKNTIEVENPQAVIDRMKRKMPPGDFERWKEQHIHTGYKKGGGSYTYYTGPDLTMPADGRATKSRYDGKKIKTNDYSNPEYKKLTDKQKQFLEYVIETKMKIEEKIPYYVEPRKMVQIDNDGMEILLSAKANTFKKLGKQLSQGMITESEEQELFGSDDEGTLVYRRPDGSVIRNAPIRFTKTLDNVDDISTDILSSLIAYEEQSINYELMTKAQPEFELVRQQIAERTFITKKQEAVSGRETETYKRLEMFLDRNVAQIRKDNLEFDIPLFGKVNVTKFVEFLSNYVRLNNLGLNIPTMFSNWAASTLFANVEDLVGEYTTIKSKNWARGEFYKNWRSSISESKEAVKYNKMWALMEYMGIAGDTRNMFDLLDKGKLTRKAAQSGLYFGYPLGDFVVKSKVMLAAMHNYRRYNGQFYTYKQYMREVGKDDYYDLQSAWDLISIDNGKVNKGVLTQQEWQQLQSRVQTISDEIDGKITPMDYAAIHQHAVFSMVAIHRNWLFSGLQKRFKSRGYDFMLGEMEEGYFRTATKALASFGIKAIYPLLETNMSDEKLAKVKKLIVSWDSLDAAQRAGVKRALYELAFATAIAFVAFTINKWADDDDEDNWLLQTAAYYSNRIVLEVTAFVNPPEYTNVIKDPIVPLRTVELMYDFKDIFSTEEIERGKYEGYTEMQRFWMRLAPGVKGVGTTMYPEATNEFLKRKPLKLLYELKSEDDE